MIPDDHPQRPPLDPLPDEMRRIGYAAVDRMVEHLESLSNQRVAKRGSAADFAAMVDEPLPRGGRGVDDSLAFFYQQVVAGMTRVNHPRFHAYIPCPSSFYGAVGEILSASTNPFVGSWLGGATFASLELTVLRWICEAIGYPSDSAGILTSGGSIANMVSLAAARHRFGRDVIEQGTLYVSDEGHHSVIKAAEVLGFRSDHIRSVPTDDQFRLDLSALSQQIDVDRRQGLKPFVVCANAGSTNTGSIDPLTAIADYCRDENLWFHIDGAYGGFAALTKEGRKKLVGLDRGDSLTLDPHKWLYSPMGVGCVLVRDRDNLEGAFRGEGDYLQDIPRDEVNFFDRGPELSRSGRVVSVWALLRSAGIDAIAEQVKWDLELARFAEGEVAKSKQLQIVCPAELSVVSFRHRLRPGETEDERAKRDVRLMERTLAEGTLMLSTTQLKGRTALRFVVMNHRTDKAELQKSLNALFQSLE